MQNGVNVIILTQNYNLKISKILKVSVSQKTELFMKLWINCGKLFINLRIGEKYELLCRKI